MSDYSFLPNIRQLLTILSKYFPSDTKYLLRRSYDTYINPSSTKLVLEVHTTLTYNEAKQHLESFDEDYWLDHMPSSDQLLIMLVTK